MDVDSSQAATALLTEHLQYTPLSLIDDIIDSVNNFVYQGVGSLETGLLATAPERLGFKPAPRDTNGDTQTEQDYPDAKQEIEEGLHKLETLLNSTVDKNFDKFEIYVLRNILSVPQEVARWVRLNHYEGIEHPPPSNTATVESVQLLRQKLAASRSVSRLLLREHQRNEAIIAQLRAATEPSTRAGQQPNFSFLTDSPALQAFQNQSQQPLTTTTNFTLSQLPALKAVAEELRLKLASLKNASLSTGTAKDERREERREYIEQRTQAQIERIRQNVDDGALINEKNVGPAEIDALEKLAGTFNTT